MPAYALDLGDAVLDVARSEAAMSCPDAERLAAAIDRVGPGVPSRQPQSRLVLEVRIDRSADGFRAQIKAFGRKSGVREIAVPGERCDGLGSALAVTLALLMDRQLAGEEPAPSGEPPPPDLRPVQPRESPRPSVRAEPIAFGGEVNAALTKGLPSGWSATAGADAIVWWGAWLASLGGFWTPATRTDFDVGRIDVQLLGARARGCGRVMGRSWADVHGGVCLLLAAGRLHGEGHGYPTTRSQDRPWLAGGVGMRGGGPIGSMGYWGVESTVLAPTYQQTFSVDLVGTGYTSEVVAWTLGVMVGARLF